MHLRSKHEGGTIQSDAPAQTGSVPLPPQSSKAEKPRRSPITDKMSKKCEDDVFTNGRKCPCQMHSPLDGSQLDGEGSVVQVIGLSCCVVSSRIMGSRDCAAFFFASFQGPLVKGAEMDLIIIAQESSSSSSAIVCSLVLTAGGAGFGAPGSANS